MKSITKQTKYKKVVGQLNDSVIKSIKKGISSNQIHVKTQQVPFRTNHQPKKSPKKTQEEEKLFDVLRKKEALESQLENIKRKEKDIKDRRTPLVLGKDKYFKSQITEQEKQQIRKVLKKTKKFEQNVKTKTQNLLDEVSKLEEEQKNEILRLKRERHQMKKKQVTENLTKIEERKIQRTNNLNKLNKNYQEVTQKTFLHQTIQNKWRALAQEKEEQRKYLAQRSREDKKFDLDEILKHQRRYSQIVNRNKDEREINMVRLKQKLTEFSRDSMYPRSTFFQVISEEQDEKRRQREEKMKQSQYFSLKKNDYSDVIRQRISKRHFQHRQLPAGSTVEIRKSKSFNQIKNLGNHNMKEIHSSISEVAIAKSRTKNQKKSQQRFKYRDYLKEMEQRKSVENPQNPKKKFFSKNDSQQIKRFKVKMYADQLNNQEINSCQDLVSNISTKLAMIEELGGSLS